MGNVRVTKCEGLWCTYIIKAFDYMECVNNVCPPFRIEDLAILACAVYLLFAVLFQPLPYLFLFNGYYTDKLYLSIGWTVDL